MNNWSEFVNTMILALLRISAMVVFAPFFSSPALPFRAKAVFVSLTALLVAPVVSSFPDAHAEISLSGILGEIAVGIVYGIVLALLNEMLLFAGHVVGMQLSFSMVNLLDPTSSIQTPLMADLFQLMGSLVMIAAGLDRILLTSLMRSFRAVPLGAYTLSPITAHGVIEAAGGIFLAALELAAPLVAATMLVEVAVALLSKLSPQLPVTLLTVPLKTLVGFVTLTGALALWPRFIEARFGSLLDLAERMLRGPSLARLGN